ncbi:MAG TPA: VWA domain-containing protein [Ignavibacteriales bacterium]|nr:VWA domain-containing protein [Ignavibacteriales bacterium]HOL80806.1 VWA domain-containing protein [Ignavibacteriales bacterium]HOM66163.1 VWA domain-containing protein [Ignavibacteriales bacterium]HPP33242.1 VWA domain-containing protein [Ignavibacteriales bacterium]HRR17918.1 VWA domain-containing protein [Ignavibacteriales bacterium]
MNYILIITYLVLIVTLIFGFIKRKNLSNLLLESYQVRKFLKNEIILLASVVGLLFIYYQKLVVYNYFNEFENTKANGNYREIYIAIDISQSMSAKDIKPDRFTAAKNKATEILNHIENSKVGIILFSENSSLIFPLTYDKNLIRNYLRNLSSYVITDLGTNFNNLLNIKNYGFSEYADKNIIILSDGENNADEINYNLLDEFKKNNIKIYTIGVGTESGAEVYSRETDFKDILKQNNKKVTSVLDKKILEKMSQLTYAKYFDISDEFNIFESKNYKHINSNQQNSKFTFFELLLIVLFVIYLTKI